ncbi:MAG: Ig-like domain-containing protein [Eubacterium sp.]|nr:Ig-like domain-containing protein [Eubacterium sp.]
MNKYEEIKKTNVNKNVTEPINPSEIKEETPENKKNNNTKKIIAIVTSVIVVICLAIGIWFVVEKNANKWDLKQNEVTIEYGEVYEPTIADFIDNEKYPNVTDDNTDVKVNATYEASKQNEELAYYAVGDYDIDVIHKIEYKLFGTTIFTMDETKKVNLSIKDTIAPVFAEDMPMELETYKDCEIENIEEKFKAIDLASVTISINKDKIDYSTVGEYTTNVQAIDESGNVTIQEIKVKVFEPTIEVDKTSLNMTVGNTETITATVKGKDQTVEWNSSDESVAKVDNGNITALKEGTATIEAEANGVKASINITVSKVEQRTPTSNNNKPSSSKNGGSSSKPSSSGGNSSSSNGGSNSNSNNNGGTSSSSGNSSTTTTTPYYCDEGGSHHRRNVGQIGWCNSIEEAENAVTKYFNEHPNFKHYTPAKCSCGKYTAYIK